MSVQDKFLDDMAKMAGSAMGVMLDSQKEMKGKMREALAEILDERFVSREEFEVVREMAANARAAQEALQTKLDMLESELAKNSTKKK